MKKRILSILLCLVMATGLLPTAAFAQDGGSAAPTERSGIVLGSGSIQTDDMVYFGVYTENGVSYNVPWRALDTNGFFLSRYTLGSSNYHNPGERFYNDSALRNVMDGFYNGNTTLFTNAERNAIKATLLSGESIYKNTYLGEVGQDMTAYVFPLSLTDVLGIGDENPRLVAPAITDPDGEGRRWWTRTIQSGVIYISTDGGIWRYGYPDSTNYDVLPAFNMELSSVLFTSAAAGGKADATADENLTAVNAYNGNEWKLTLKDSSRSFSANVNGQTSVSTPVGSSVQIAYSGAQTGSNEYVSVLLCDSSDTVLYYGNIAQSSAIGMATLNISSELTAGNYTLKVFSEQCNGDKKTDYASAFQDIALTVLSREATPSAMFTATGDNGGTLSGVDTSMKYSVDGGTNWNDITGETMDITGVTAEKDVKVYKPGDGTTTVDSEVQTIDITQAAQPTGIEKADCTTSEQNNGQITGVDTTMEYKLFTDSDWTAITGTVIEGLADGTYEVRVKANGTVLASVAATVTIGAHTCVAQGDWQYDETSHWKLCACGAKVEETAHSGGTATCKSKAKCEVCGESYGELDGNNHADLKHIDAKAATKTAEGNVEYWYCEGCGKYYKDAAAKQEIAKADTVTAKLPDDSKSPQTGDNSNLALWIALLFVSGGAGIFTTVYGRKRKRSIK